MSPRLGPGAAHLWYVRTEDARDPGLAEEYRGLMTAAEAEAERRYTRPDNQLEHRVARALVRTTLSQHCDVDPRDWVFRAGPHGRPEIAHPAVPRLHFNLSHTEGLVACLIAWDRDVGVDVECVTRPAKILELAARYFAPAEVTAIRAAPPATQRELFFRTWTLKEAYVKARGVGLSLPLDRFAFSLAGACPVVAFAPPVDDSPSRWHFTLHAPTRAHVLATAIDRADMGAIDLRVSSTLPLRR